jgi:HTH-type transcriptional repressor of NAD biosynthesis genes
VVVLGAESTGTTTLSRALAAELGTLWVEEYGREYSEIRAGGLAAPWRSDEFDLVVDRQLQLEQQALRRVPKPLLVCDTDVLATALWHERYVGEPAPRILRRGAAHRPALYVLTGDEIPFVQDGMRDGEHIRHDMQQRFREVLAAQAVPWVEVRGSVEARTAAVLPLIADLRP